MASLTTQTISGTYLTLLKLTTAALGSGVNGKFIEDAAGTDSALSISTTRVGIGTAAPEGSLHIYGSTTDNTRIMIDEDDTGDPFLHLRLTGGQDWSVGIDNSEDDKFMIGSDNSPGTDPHLTIDVDGNVGIGTISPTQILNVSVSGDQASVFIDCYNGTADSPSRLLLRSAQGTEGGGHAAKTISSGDHLGQIAFAGYDDDGFDRGAQIYALADATWSGTERGTDLRFQTRDANAALADQMCITAEGYVGIGTMTPATMLHVAGAFAASGASKTFGTFSSSDTTPSVAAGNLWKTHASGQTLTTFDDGVAGQTIVVISTAAVVFAISGVLQAGTTNITTASGDVTSWIYDGTNWYLLSWMDDSEDLSSGGF